MRESTEPKPYVMKEVTRITVKNKNNGGERTFTQQHWDRLHQDVKDQWEIVPEGGATKKGEYTPPEVDKDKPGDEGKEKKADETLSPNPDDALKAKAIELNAAGKELKEISKELGISQKKVKELLK